MGLIRLYAQLLVVGSVLVLGQFPPAPEGLTIVQSQVNPSISISFKDTGLCDTAPGARSLAGHVRLPPNTPIGDTTTPVYPINTFFWYFQARNNPENAPLAVWLQGGPGTSSMVGAFVENGPCFITPDGNSTIDNPWSWNNEVNMLYVDQPVQTGFSYDVLTNYTLDLLTGRRPNLDTTITPVPVQNATLMVGTGSSNNSASVPLGSRNAATNFWQFLQVWMQDFPEYRTSNKLVSLTTESYGGQFGPEFANMIMDQNDRISNGSLQALPINLDTLLLINACIDRQVQYPGFQEMAVNNTYSILAINETVQQQMEDAYSLPGACRDQVQGCVDLAKVLDPDSLGTNNQVSDACANAEAFCTDYIRDYYLDTTLQFRFDMTQQQPEAFPPKFFTGWLNRPHVQAALGVPLNFSAGPATAVSRAFRLMGDYPRPGGLAQLGRLLDNGVKVHLAYGDRDFTCNWMGGEMASLAVNYSKAAEFRAAGYTDLRTNDSYVGGMVRQVGNFSFSRVFDAGHEMPAYQPETAHAIFRRAILNMDIATGGSSVLGNLSYATVGPSDTLAIRNVVPPPQTHFCYVLDAEDTCTPEQLLALGSNTARVVNYIVEDANSLSLFPDMFVQASDRSTAGMAAGPVTVSTASILSEASLHWISIVAGLICVLHGWPA